MKKKHKILVFLFFPIMLAAFLIYTISGFLVKSFNGLTMEEIVFHLKVPMKGTSNSMFKDYFKYAKWAYVIFIPALLLIAVIINGFKKIKESTAVLCSFITFAMTCLAYAICKFGKVMKIPSYIAGQLQKSDFLANNYVDPKKANISLPEEKRNLIYIYLESMESTYASKAHGGAMNEELIPELYQLARENIHFSNTDRLGGASVSLGSTWTTGAMFTQSTGLPLTLPLKSKRFKDGEFLPKFTAIGDILAENGYNQEIIVGSDLAFGGRKMFYESHGNYKIFDYKSAVNDGKLPPKYYKWWGFEDQKLFKFAKEELYRLAEKDEPFNLTLLTVDTHHIGGYKCELCGNEHENNYENVLSCSSKQVAKFLDWLKDQDFYENTTVVLVGDHPTMDNIYISDRYDGSVKRCVYNCFINPSKELKVHSDRLPNRNFNTFDIFPTTMAALGAKWDGSRLGIGTNLFSDDPTLNEKYGSEYIESELAKQASIYN